MNKILKIHILGFFIISVIGTLIHFTYELSNYTYVIGIFSAVNESIFEHLKLLVFGIVIFMLYEHIILYKDNNRYLFARLVSIIIGVFSIITIYYTYTFFTKESIVIIDIILFYLSVLISQIISYKILVNKLFKFKENHNKLINKHSKYLLIITICIFFFFTFYPPKINMFKDPITGNYGILNLK